MDLYDSTQVETVTEDNFNPEAYLAANEDVRKAGVDPKEHFDNYGKDEGRRQLVGLPRHRATKYARFRHLLEAPHDDSESGKFPIVTSTAHFDLSSYAHESANPGFGPFDHYIEANPDKLFMDLGCGFRDKTFANCLYLEVYASRSADLIVEPNCLYPIRSGTLDGIGCFAVLEHTRKPWQVVAEMQRMLKPGGKVFIDWPFLQPVHGFPSHFFNATREGLKSVFEDSGFTVDLCETGAHQTAAYTMRWVFGAMAQRLPEGPLREEFEGLTVRELVAMDVQGERWWRFLNALDPDAFSELACGNWLMATKGSYPVLFSGTM